MDASVLLALILAWLIAVNRQIVGRQRGRQLGLIGFVASAPKYSGAEFDGFRVGQKGWGLQKGDYAARRIQAFRDACDFPSIFLASALMMRAWPVRVIGTSADTSLA